MKKFLLLLLVISTSATISARYFYASVEGTLKLQDGQIKGNVTIDNRGAADGPYFITFSDTDNNVLTLYKIDEPSVDSKDNIFSSSCRDMSNFNEVDMSLTPTSLKLGRLTITCSDNSLYKKFFNHLLSPKLSETPKDMALAVKCNDNVYFATVDDWRKIKNKQDFEIIGITFCRSGENFILFWKDQYDFDDGYMAQELAVEKYGDYLPTKAQANLISNCTELRYIARQFGSDNYGNYYWTRTRCLPPDENCAYIFCPGIPDATYDRSPADESSQIGVVLVISLD